METSTKVVTRWVNWSLGRKSPWHIESAFATDGKTTACGRTMKSYPHWSHGTKPDAGRFCKACLAELADRT